MVSKKNHLDIGNCLFDSCDTDNFLGIFSDPKPTFPFKNIQHEQYDDLELDSAGKEVPVNSEMESAEVLNIPDFLMNSTKTYTRKNGSVMLSHKKSTANSLVPSIGKKRGISSKRLSFQNVRTSDVFNASNSNELCNSVEINRLSSKRLKRSVNSSSKKSKLIYETGDECTKNGVNSSTLPCKKLNGTYARTRKNLAQKIVLGTNTNLKERSGEHKNTRSSRCKNPIINSQSYSHSFVDSSVSLPKKLTSPVNKTSVHEKKDYDNTLQSLLLKFSEKPNDNLKNVSVQKNIKQKSGFESSQSKKAPEEQTIIHPKALFNSNASQKLKKGTDSVNSDLNKSLKKMIQHLNVKPKKPLTRTCSEILNDKIYKKSKGESATTLPVKRDSFSLNKELENIFNSNQKSDTISSKNSSVKNTNCFETEYTGNINLNSNQGIKHVANSDKPLIKNQSNPSLNQEVKLITTSNNNILAGNPVSGMLTPVVLNSGSIFNSLPQMVTPPVFQPYTYYPTTVHSLNLGNNPTIYVMPCCNCSHSSNSSEVINAFNKSMSSSIPPPIFQISGDATNLDSILKQLHDFYHRPVQQTSQNKSFVNRNHREDFNVKTTITNRGSSTQNVANPLSQNCVENSHICDHQTDSLEPDLDSVMNENLEEERLKTRSRSAKMAGFMAFTADLIKDVHGMSLEEIRNYLSKHNHDIVKRLTVSKFYTQTQDVIDSFCFTSVDNFTTKYKLPNEFKNMSLSTLLKDYVKFHLQHIIKAHPQRPFNVSRFSVLKQGKSQLNFFEKILFRNLCNKYQKLNLKNLIKILSFVGIITLYIQHQSKDLIHFKQKIEMGQKAK